MRIKRRFSSHQKSQKYIQKHGQHSLKFNVEPLLKSIRSSYVVDDTQEIPFLKLNELNNHQQTIIYLHGGAFVEGCTSFHIQLCDKLAQATNTTVIIPLYSRLPYSNALQTLDELMHIIRLNISHNHSSITLMGDSAGGWLALSLSKLMSELKYVITDCILLSPWIDLSLTHVRDEIEKKDVILSAEGLRYIGEQFNPGCKLGYHVSLDVTHVNKSMIIVAQNEIFVDEAIIFQDKALSQGVDTELYIYDGLFHDFMLFPLPESNDVFERIVSRVKK